MKQVIAICNLPDGVKLDHAWFVAEDGLYAQKVVIRPLPQKRKTSVDADLFEQGVGYGWNDCLDEIVGKPRNKYE